MIIKNIDNHDFDFSFNFNTYSIPKNKMVNVSDDLASFLEERWPNSFSFKIEVKKPVSDVTSIPSKSLIKRQGEELTSEPTMTGTSSREKATFGITDEVLSSGVANVDGVQLEGEGLVYE